ncbi:MAG: alpha/beta fold hydrolase [Lachnospiraceae bacterium]|nr:alpha/beta fold hydrolase [Lachnospiraceae bacterium]
MRTDRAADAGGVSGAGGLAVVVGAGTDYPLNGLLTLPRDHSAPVPAVVMVHGSGPSNMDEKVMKLTPFKDLAEGLARQGIASLRYDKRTFAHGRKMIRNKSLTVKEETIEDAILAVQMLKKDPRIDHSRIFLLGHSMGAMLAPRIDAEGADVKGLILMAGTPYRLEDIVLRQLKQAGRRKSILRPLIRLEYGMYRKRFQGLYEMSDEEAKKKKFAGNLTLYYFKEMGQKTAADYLLESRKPVLIMQGGKDFQVLAKKDYRGFRKMLAGRPDTGFKLYPDLNHLFVKGIFDDILKASKDYKVERHIPEEVVGDIAGFVNGESGK